MSRVRRKLGQERVGDPLGPELDPFAEFRDVLLLGVEHHFKYRHSLGKTSKFFLAIEEGKLLATRCEKCGKVWLPPRPICPDDLGVTEWVELSGKGTLETWTVSPKAPIYAHADGPFALAYVRFEGASTLFLHQLRNPKQIELRHGLPLRAVFASEPVDHPINLLWLEPS